MESLEKDRVGVGVDGEEITDGYSSFFGSRCGWVTIPRMALLDVVWMLIARSGKARDCGSYMSRPPFFNFQIKL